VRTCIGRGDSIESGKSYYLAEAEAIRDLLGASVDNQPHLFILDELYRGTNTVERIAAGRAVLEYLDHPPHLVLVATHDIELTRWLGERYVQFHFREQVVDGELTFDYRLKPGVSSTRNAIAWLEALGYPDEVVRVAEDTVERPSV
jgi:DNA mismatch repair ATPase MutS